jgi:hypothetical protein
LVAASTQAKAEASGASASAANAAEAEAEKAAAGTAEAAEAAEAAATDEATDESRDEAAAEAAEAAERDLIARFGYFAANRAIAAARNTGRAMVARFFFAGTSGSTRSAARTAITTDHSRGCCANQSLNPS